MDEITLGRAIELYLGGFIPTTRQTYASVLLPMRDWIGAECVLTTIRPELVIEYFNEMMKRKYATATLKKTVKSIRSFFNWCINIDLIARSPAKSLKVPQMPDLIPRNKAMSDDELTALLTAAYRKTVPRDYALILFLSDTGCRIGGAVGLREADLQLDKLIATVTEKGARPRTVAFSSRCADALRDWLAYRAKHYHLESDYIFGRHGQFPKTRNLALEIRRACWDAGIRSLGPHSMRHRMGWKLADLRFPASVRAAALGDTTEVVDKFYSPGDWERAEEALREVQQLTHSASDPTPPPAAQTIVEQPSMKTAKIIQFPGTKGA